MGGPSRKTKNRTGIPVWENGGRGSLPVRGAAISKKFAKFFSVTSRAGGSPDRRRRAGWRSPRGSTWRSVPCGSGCKGRGWHAGWERRCSTFGPLRNGEDRAYAVPTECCLSWGRVTDFRACAGRVRLGLGAKRSRQIFLWADVGQTAGRPMPTLDLWPETGGNVSFAWRSVRGGSERQLSHPANANSRPTSDR
jgi:hypothetical protein